MQRLLETGHYDNGHSSFQITEEDLVSILHNFKSQSHRVQVCLDFRTDKHVGWIKNLEIMGGSLFCDVEYRDEFKPKKGFSIAAAINYGDVVTLPYAGLVLDNTRISPSSKSPA